MTPSLPKSDTDSTLHDPADAENAMFSLHKTQSYMNSLVPPSKEDFEHIAQIQERKELELRQRDRERQRQSAHSLYHITPHDHERTRAAKLIQKTFRGHRARREMYGYGLDASTRWVAALREAEFRQMTRPRSTGDRSSSLTSRSDDQELQVHEHSPEAMRLWRMAGVVARRAGHDDKGSDTSSISSVDSDTSPEERERIRSERDRILDGRRRQAQMMGLQYFLEMVDTRHRYGANLRIYHAEWNRSDTKENFFYWLDFGQGRNIELDSCPRDRLDRERIRYLSREERRYYLVEVDDEGRLRWAKNRERIDTTEQFRDSIHGIVPMNDTTPLFYTESQSRETAAATSPVPGNDISHRERLSVGSIREADRAAKYASQDPSDPDEHNHLKRVKHFSATTIWNKLLQKTVKNGTWIFVADTSFRLYVGIKDSGTFQHSSFLQGGRISAAGLIGIKDGRITMLSPLSGHYRPPASNFRAFVRSLGEAGVDTSQITISKSYVVLVGMEAFSKTKETGKRLVGRFRHGTSGSRDFQLEQKHRDDEDLSVKIQGASLHERSEVGA